MSEKNDYFNEKGETPEKIELKEIYYICTECPSSIEILSINEKECIFEFRCIKNNHKKKMPIKEYLNKMKDIKDTNINKDICIHHQYLKYEYYCSDCNKHLCKECLESRNHISHNKNIILEIKPNQKELNQIENIIKYYEEKKEHLEKEKVINIMQINNKLKESKKN